MKRKNRHQQRKDHVWCFKAWQQDMHGACSQEKAPSRRGWTAEVSTTAIITGRHGREIHACCLQSKLGSVSQPETTLLRHRHWVRAKDGSNPALECSQLMRSSRALRVMWAWWLSQTVQSQRGGAARAGETTANIQTTRLGGWQCPEEHLHNSGRSQGHDVRWHQVIPGDAW